MYSATDTNGEATYLTANTHGDTVNDIDMAGGGTWNYADEFGTPGTHDIPTNHLGWLGDKQRYTEDQYGTGSTKGTTTRMGNRLYDSRLGRFLQKDPVEGGSTNSYDYCNADPINCRDLQGTFAFKKWLHRFATGAGVVASGIALAALSPIAVPGALVAAGAVSAALISRQRSGSGQRVEVPLLGVASIGAAFGETIAECRSHGRYCGRDAVLSVGSLGLFGLGAGAGRIGSALYGPIGGPVAAFSFRVFGSFYGGMAAMATSYS